MDKIFTVQKIFFMMVIFSTQSCPFKNYDEALISQNTRYEKADFQLPIDKLSDSNAYLVGFWSMYVPQLEFDSPTIADSYDETKSEDGYILILINHNQDHKIVGFMEIDKELQTLSHKFIFFGQKSLEIILKYSSNNYEGQWIFTLLTFYTQNQMVSIESNHNEKQIIMYTMEEKYFLIFLGGKGNILDYNLNVFKGQLSKLIIQNQIHYQDDLFSNYVQFCAIPNKYDDEQVIEIINGLKLFDNDNILQSQFQQVGNNFYLTGWIKFNFQKLSNIMEAYPLLRISTRKNHLNQFFEGDELFQIYIQVNRAQPESTKYFILMDCHTFPYLSALQENKFSRLEIFQNPSSTGSLYFYGLQEWHYLSYQHYEFQQEVRSLLQLQFFNQLGLVQYQSQNFQLKNSIFFVFIGGDYFFQNLFNGMIYNLRFKFNFEKFIDSFLLACHYSCLQCNGPLETNCLQCSSSSQRVYLDEQQKCSCIFGYIELGLNNCIQFSTYFPKITIEEIEKKTKNPCRYDQFQFSTLDGTILCLQCPQANHRDKFCADCIENPENWFLQPICKYDLINLDLNNQFAYIKTLREEKQFDIYFISENGFITYFPEYQQFCTSIEEQNCIQAQTTHLGQLPIVKCKSNYFVLYGKCVEINPQCQSVDIQGKCTLTIDGIYLINDDFFKCPTECSKCNYDNNNKTVICQECTDGYAIINNQCKKCGEYCLTCISNYDKQRKENYLMCLQCSNNSDFFLSLDGQNCLKNKIVNCQYAFQAMKADYTVNTFNYKFTPLDYQSIIDQTEIICAKCNEGYVYLIEENLCISGLMQNCYIGISQNQENLQNQTCIYQENKISEAVSMMYKFECFLENFFCLTCILNKESKYACLECQNGYYSKLLQMICHPCPIELNCFSCYEQQKYYQDHWKFSIRPFYKMFIDNQNTNPLLKNFNLTNKFESQLIFF